jgi:hypothetical protein
MFIALRDRDAHPCGKESNALRTKLAAAGDAVVEEKLAECIPICLLLWFVLAHCIGLVQLLFLPLVLLQAQLSMAIMMLFDVAAILLLFLSSSLRIAWVS